MVIVLAIAALVGGYFFLKYYNNIDVSFFGSTSEDYEPFGSVTVLFCALAGAVSTGGEFINEITRAGWYMKDLHIGALVVGAVCLSYCIYNAIIRMKSTGAIVGKIVFLWAACGIGALVGALGSVVVLCVVILVMVLYIIGGALSGGSKSGKRIVLEDGTEVEEKSGLLGEKYYKGKDGRDFDRIGEDLFREK